VHWLLSIALISCCRFHSPLRWPSKAQKSRFPVRRIVCVGRNDAAHVREMGRHPDRKPPFFFVKP
jgi:2-keto-4-pentenoate hydratase/2-oxohepta-3-ene-1,7-dioic acid hydratase in catechol pathway